MTKVTKVVKEKFVKVDIKQLGIQFQESKSEKAFKALFVACEKGVHNKFLQFGNSIELIEDCYNETMISIWNDIDKFDVHTYSISTMIYMKMTQNIIRHYKSVGGQFTKCDIDDPIIVNKVVTENMGDFTFDLQDDFIRDENVDTLWNSIEQVLDNETNFKFLYDKYARNMSTKDIATKYGTLPQNVLNRVFNAKKKLESNKQNYKNLYNEIIS